MNKGVSAILTVLVLVVLIGGGYLAYNLLINKAPVGPSSGNADININANANTNANTESAAQSNTKIKAPDFTVINAEGNLVKLSDMQGKPVVLNFWASWCPPCKSEMPEFEKVNQELGGSVQFMMVDVTDGGRETQDTGAAYISSQGFTFPVFYDTNQDASRKYSIRAIPTTFFIDSGGYVVNSQEGAISGDALRTNINVIAAAAQPQKAEYHKITPADAKAIMDSTQPYTLVDVRTDSEYQSGHIKGAILIPSDVITNKAASELPDKNALIIVYCRSGARSSASSKALVNMGYTKVYDLGGIMDWPYETVTD